MVAIKFLFYHLLKNVWVDLSIREIYLVIWNFSYFLLVVIVCFNIHTNYFLLFFFRINVQQAIEAFIFIVWKFLLIYCVYSKNWLILFFHYFWSHFHFLQLIIVKFLVNSNIQYVITTNKLFLFKFV